MLQGSCFRNRSSFLELSVKSQHLKNSSCRRSASISQKGIEAYLVIGSILVYIRVGETDAAGDPFCHVFTVVRVLFIVQGPFRRRWELSPTSRSLSSRITSLQVTPSLLCVFAHFSPRLVRLPRARCLPREKVGLYSAAGPPPEERVKQNSSTQLCVHTPVMAAECGNAQACSAF